MSCTNLTSCDAAPNVAEIIKGSDRDLTVQLIRKATKLPYDFTDIQTIKACVLKEDRTSLFKMMATRTAATINGSATIALDTTDLEEGISVSGAGIQSNTVILKTPRSEEDPTAAGTILLSKTATATQPSVSLLFGDISVVGDAILGRFMIPYSQAETDEMLSGIQSLEVKVVTDDIGLYKIFENQLNIIERVC